MFFSKIKKKFAQQLDQVEPYLGFTKAVTEEVIGLREKPNMFDYVGLGLVLREHYLDYFGRPVVEYFPGGDWEPLQTFGLYGEIARYLTQKYETNIVPVKDKETQQTVVDGIRFGWISDTDSEAFTIYVTKGEKDSAQKIIKSILWNNYKDSCMVVGLSEDANRFVLLEDITPNLIKSAAGKKITERIKKYLQEGKKRSILFYGPPGSGKSQMIKGIAHSLNLNMLRFEDFEYMIDSMGSFQIINMVNLIDPDLIVIEDVDHNFSDYNSLLDKMESFHASGKMVFVTANRANLLDDALLRAGRINETIEVKRLEEEVILELVKNDRDIFEIVRDFPASFIVEVMERVEVLGKREALSGINDIQQRIQKMNGSNYELIDDESEEFLE